MVVMVATTAIVIMITPRVMKALTLRALWWPQGHYSHGGYNGHGVTMATSVTTVTRAIKTTKTKTVTMVIMTTIATTATVASKSCWLHKIRKDGALTSQSLKVTHLYLKVQKLKDWHTSWKSTYIYFNGQFTYISEVGIPRINFTNWCAYILKSTYILVAYPLLTATMLYCSNSELLDYQVLNLLQAWHSFQ